MEFNTFEAIKIGLASPETIRRWSSGEVKKPETINYRTLKPERDGLFCERIFGPTKDWECHCGKYKRLRYKGKVCERCGVEVTRSKVRRERMGHIELAAPVSHIWYFKGTPSRLGLVLDLSPRVLEKVLYFALYIVIDPGDVRGIREKDTLTESEYRDLREKYGDGFEAEMGASAIKKLLLKIDKVELRDQLLAELETASGQKRGRIVKRLDAIESFITSGNELSWMILDVLPVIPPEIRPMVQLDGGRFASSDLNDLYRRVINRNNRLKRLLELNAPDIIVRNEKRMLQEAVDALIDNGRRSRAVGGPNNRALKSLSDMLKGKQGRFRQNLLGKRVDYSGRSVIVVGPDLKIYQCGLPKEMAIELFKPFVMKRLEEMGIAKNIKSAKKMVERMQGEVWDALEEVIKEHPVLLNRAPTLHRLGIQAFEPVLVEGRALRLHPLVCTAYNADFDGDQMAVHVPLSSAAQAEARFLMLSANNLLKPQDGKPVTVPTQDMVLGAYYLTMVKDKDKPTEQRPYFKDVDEAKLAYDAKTVTLHEPVRLRVDETDDNGEKTGEHIMIDTSIGRIIFNEVIPQNLGFMDRTNPEQKYKLEIDQIVTKKVLGQIIDRCIKANGGAETADTLDKIKSICYQFSTKGAITVSVSDMTIPPKKYEYIEQAEAKIEEISENYKMGLMTDDERYSAVIDQWEKTTKLVTEELEKGLDEFNPIYMMANSGARGSMSQIRQLAGMRGLMANTSGKAIEIPIRSNFREGLNILEFFISSRGARKGLADTALRTADSGYLTRRLVDVSQDVIIREDDCGTDEGLMVTEIPNVEKLPDRLLGRFAAKPIVHPETGEVIVDTDKPINDKDVKAIMDAGIKKVEIRSVLKCRCKYGVCAKCYGKNLAANEVVRTGEAVGIIAAQSIGEPGTQLTMRTFHTGGVAGKDVSDITQGLPRVEELFEARKPKALAVLAEISGRVTFDEIKKIKNVIVTNDEGESVAHPIVFSLRLKEKIEMAEKNGTECYVEKGEELTQGSKNPRDILRILGPDAVQEYFIEEVQRVYRLQGVDINDKHIEVIVRQMMKKYKVLDPGSAEPVDGLQIVEGAQIDKYYYLKAKEQIEERRKNGEDVKDIVVEPELLGITKASLATDSFLSAASFQETTKVLTDAAIRGKTDPLIGLKENVIIGKLIPAGTGLPRYRNVEIVDNTHTNNNQ